MGTTTVKPNATSQIGTGGGVSNAHTLLSDASDATGVTVASPFWWGNSTPDSSACVVEFPDVSVIPLPANSGIISVNPGGRVRVGSLTTNGTGIGGVSFRYSDNIEMTRLDAGSAPANTTYAANGGLFTAANRYDGGASKGPWTTALFNGIKAVIGSTTGPSQSPSPVYDIWMTVVYSDYPTAAPTAVTPASGGTVTTGNPALGATLAAVSTGQKQRVEWQFATDSGFTANVKTVTMPTTANKTSGAYTYTPTGLNLVQGTQYIRARALDEFGAYGPYSAGVSFTVAHVPSTTSQDPTGDIVRAYAATNRHFWTFSDSDSTDAQTAYQIIVERNDTGASVLDTGKVTSANGYADIAIPSAQKDQPLRWKIKVWDRDNVAGSYSNYHLFRVSDAPVVTITAPTASQVIGTGQPTVTWTLDAATTQVSRSITIRKPSDGLVPTYQTGTVTTTATSWTAPNNILENNTSYTVSVTVVDQDGLTSTSQQSFSTSYQAPATVNFTVDGSTFEDSGYVSLDWSQMQSDDFFVDWRVYRRLSGTSTWENLAIYPNASIVTYHDWTAGANNLYEYTVTQTGGRSGVVLESTLVASAPVIASSTHYWLINPYDETDNLKLDLVKSDSFTDGYDESELIIIGRGRKINHGTRFGYDGSLTAEFRDSASGTARAKRLKLEALKSARTSYYLRNPFGDLWLVAMGNISVSRIEGVGTYEFVDVTIPYKEVF